MPWNFLLMTTADILSIRAIALLSIKTEFAGILKNPRIWAFYHADPDIRDNTYLESNTGSVW
jgi:hypothetical protein